jgi:hypothetical protein
LLLGDPLGALQPSFDVVGVERVEVGERRVKDVGDDG